MTESELLEKALRSSATIHQPHALKAFLAAQKLYGILGEPEGIWQQVSDLISMSELTVSDSLTDVANAPAFTDVRIRRILGGGIYPAAYQALAQWHENNGFEDIFAYYVVEASKHNENLCHNITILLAFNSVYSQLSGEQMAPFLNRVTEFVTSTFTQKEITELTYLDTTPSFSELLKLSLKQPNFFGHNLITLAWLIRCKHMLTQQQLNSMSYHLFLQATSPLEDREDNLDLLILNSLELNSSKDEFYRKINALTFDVCSNLHQVTLADALIYLQNKFPQQTANLGRIANYYLRWMKS